MAIVVSYLECSITYKHMPWTFLEGDQFYSYSCSKCTRGRDILYRLKVTWSDIIYLILYHLEHRCESSMLTRQEAASMDTKLFHWKVVMDYFRLHWSKFYSKSLPPSSSWQNAAIGHLSSLLSSGKVMPGGKKKAGIDNANFSRILCGQRQE